MLPVNQVFKLDDRRLRLLWCDDQIVVLIDIDDHAAMPNTLAFHEAEEMIMDGELEHIEDPFLPLALREVEKGSTDWQKRESAWNMIEQYVNDFGLFERCERGKITRHIIESYGVTKQTVYRLFRRYWQRGMCRNALLPDYFKSGAQGQRRSPKSAKLGRPRVVREGKGSNVTAEIARIFRRVIDSRLLKEKHTSIPDAYAKALNLMRAKRPDLPLHGLPTLEQFRYFYKHEYDAVKMIEKRFSAINYAKDIRPIKSTSTTEALGPGYRYQFDATIADIYLVSEHNPSLIVGRPVIYLVVDVFSRMVTGLYIGFEGPSWVSAMMALANTVTDKVQYCHQFGIEIEEGKWPVRGLPSVVLADKGELNGTKVETFSEAFGVRIENAPARRGDAKGIVERYFRTVQEEFKPYAPGVITPQISRKQGGSDYRREASLTLREFTQEIIEAILYHNNFHVMGKYDRPAGMPGDIPAVPIKLWNWGLANLTGRLRQAHEDLVRINLLPHDHASVSELGIRLFGCVYSCPEAMKMGWFHRAQQGRRPQRVQVAYDPRIADYIYIRPNNNLSDYWVCSLMDRSRRFRGMTFWEVWGLSLAERKADANASMDAAKEKGKLLEKIEAISTAAQARHPIRSGMSRKDLGMQIRQNKMAEKRQERQTTAVRPAKTGQKKPADVIPLQGDNPRGYAIPDRSELLFGDNDHD